VIALLIGLAIGAEPVVLFVSNGHVNWTEGLLRAEVSMVQNTAIWRDTRATEKDARQKLQAHLQEQALKLPVSGGLRAKDVIEQWPEIEEAMTQGLADGMGHWRVVETRYYTSGRVELVGELDLTEWLRPYASLVASGRSDAPNEKMRSSGIVVDARHLELEPSYAPRLVDPRGYPVYDLTALSKQVASTQMPVLWVRDAADIAVVERVGDSPAMMVAQGTENGHDLVLSSRDAARFRLLAGGTSLLQSAPIVIVVSP
jgi:hypothetical protein